MNRARACIEASRWLRVAVQHRLSPLYGALEVKHLFSRILHFLSFLHTVSLFDLESRFFAPTHTCWRPTRTGSVKVGRRSALAAPSAVFRPRLDRHEHGGTLVVVGTMI